MFYDDFWIIFTTRIIFSESLLTIVYPEDKVKQYKIEIVCGKPISFSFIEIYVY